jgi:hypothetical protein
MVNGHRIRDDAYLRTFGKRLIEHCFHIDLEFYNYVGAEVRFAW